MNIREALLAAADKIESEPERFNFDSTYIPGKTCGAPGCAIGWTAAFYEMTGDSLRGWIVHDVGEMLGIPHGRGNCSADMVFYGRMDQVEREAFGLSESERLGWMVDAKRCARVMRLYADKYHPAPQKQTGIPDSIRAIFNPQSTTA